MKGAENPSPNRKVPAGPPTEETAGPIGDTTTDLDESSTRDDLSYDTWDGDDNDDVMPELVEQEGDKSDINSADKLHD